MLLLLGSLRLMNEEEREEGMESHGVAGFIKGIREDVLNKALLLNSHLEEHEMC